MESGTPEPAGPALTALRDAATRVGELVPAAGADDADDRDFDAADHAARYEDLHEALTAVLDELDRA